MMAMSIKLGILVMVAHIQIQLDEQTSDRYPTQQGMNDCEIFGDENTNSDGGEEDEEYTDDSADSNEVG